MELALKWWCYLFCSANFLGNHEGYAQQYLTFGPTGHVNETLGSLTVNFFINFNITSYILNATVALGVVDWVATCKRDVLTDYFRIIDMSINNASQLELNAPKYTENDLAFVTQQWQQALQADINKKVLCVKNTQFNLAQLEGSNQTTNQSALFTVIDTVVSNWMLRRITTIIRSMARSRQQSITRMRDDFMTNPKVQALNAYDEYDALLANQSVHDISDLSLLLAKCANFTAYFGTRGLTFDKDNRTGFFALVVSDLLMKCCSEMFVRPNFTDLIEDIHNATVTKIAAEYNNNKTLIEVLHYAYTFNLVTYGWLQQLQRFLHDLDGAYSLESGDLWATHVDAQPPISPSVIIVSLAINISGSLDSTGLMAKLRYQNLIQNITLSLNRTKIPLWIYEDPGEANHHDTAVTATVISWLNFITALGVTGYFVRQLRKSERYQLPVPKEQETDEYLDSAYS